ncbi:MAG: histidinol dehydrogenase [Pseudomonadota bacterium]
MFEIKSLNANNDNFINDLNKLLAWDSSDDQQVQDTVRKILQDVKQTGDKAVLEYTNRFDRLTAQHINDLVIQKHRLKAAYENLPEDQKNALDISAQRVEKYHLKQKLLSWSYTEEDGTLLGQQVTPLERVGLYVPGGQAAYPSSVLMNAIPAKVAGVKELIMVVPTPDGKVNELVLAAAAICDVDIVFAIGGAQAVAALAYGTETIPQVDKIVGPGNIYVATAKGMVFGSVGIDMIAGPSEILVICDGKTNPDWIAMDLFSQAEHDEDAQSILISQDSDYLEQVKQSIARLLPEMERREIIEKSLQSRAIFIQVDDLEQAALVSNHIAPEHLELSIDNPQDFLPQIKHAGAIFMGRYTAEAVGDYCAGPNHVLPTSRTARFSSPLGVYDFQKRSSLIMCSADGASELGKVASIMARGEGLTAHARSAEYRIK